MPSSGALPVQIAARIVTVRGQRVLLDADLAALYGVETRVLLQAVRRNAERFPPDFLIRLENQELSALRSQFVISKTAGRGGRRHPAQAFTEHGSIMAATVLNSARAIAVSVFVVRAFIQMREALVQHGELGKRLDELEARLEERLGKQDQTIVEILDAIHHLMSPPESPQKPAIGFVR